MDHGDLVTFHYPAVHKRKSRAHDPNPTVLVLHPNYEGKVHGLNWGLMTPNQQNMIRMILDVGFEQQHKQALTRQDPSLMKEYDKVVGMASVTEINQPYPFYQQVIKKLISAGNLSASGVKYEPYRQYTLTNISSVRILQPAAIMMGSVPQESDSLLGKLFNKIRGTRGSRFRR